MDFPSHKIKCDGKLILIQFPNGNTYNCRHISYKEYLLFKSLYEAFTVPSTRVDESLAKAVVQDSIFQDGQWLNQQYAGLCRTIANLVMYLGANHYDHGDTQTFEHMLNSARMEASSVDNMMFSVICHVYSGYTFSDVADLTYAEIIRLYANAERFLLETGQMKEPLQISLIGQEGQDIPKTTQGTDAQGRMIIPTSEIETSQQMMSYDHDLVLQHDNDMRKMMEKRASEQEKVDFNSPEGQRIIRERNRRLAQHSQRKPTQQSRKQKTFSTRKKKE